MWAWEKSFVARAHNLGSPPPTSCSVLLLLLLLQSSFMVFATMINDASVTALPGACGPKPRDQMC